MKNYAIITQELRHVLGNVELRKNYANHTKITQITKVLVPKSNAYYATPTLPMVDLEMDKKTLGITHLHFALLKLETVSVTVEPVISNLTGNCLE